MIDSLHKEKVLKEYKHVKIKGGKALSGQVTPDGAKNSALIHLAAACLVDDGILSLNNLPLISDVYMSLNMLEEAGLKCKLEETEAKIFGRINSGNFSKNYAAKIRSSLAFLGSVIPMVGEISLPLPGGDKIGERPIDIHLDVLNAFDIETEVKAGIINAKAKSLPLQGQDIYLRFPSVLATVNAILLSVLAQGTSRLSNVAKEPEIVDLVSFLSKMGAKITGAGTSNITIHGVESLSSAYHEIMPDRLETGALVMTFVLTGGHGVVNNIIPEHNIALVHMLKSSGVDIVIDDDKFLINASQPNQKFHVETMPYPGMATDLQPIITPFALVCPEGSIITDNIFKERFSHVNELRKMGANIERNGNTIKVLSKEKLVGSDVHGGDIRSVVSLIGAGLAAEGETRVTGVDHLMRGHCNYVEKLKALNADIELE